MQTHLFEDRALKAAPLRIGRRCEVGALSVVLYDSEMEDGARLDALSLLMKGERLPAGTSWAGSPAALCRDYGLSDRSDVADWSDKRHRTYDPDRLGPVNGAVEFLADAWVNGVRASPGRSTERVGSDRCPVG